MICSIVHLYYHTRKDKSWKKKLTKFFCISVRTLGESWRWMLQCSPYWSGTGGVPSRPDSPNLSSSTSNRRSRTIAPVRSVFTGKPAPTRSVTTQTRALTTGLFLVFMRKIQSQYADFRNLSIWFLIRVEIIIFTSMKGWMTCLMYIHVVVWNLYGTLKFIN